MKKNTNAVTEFKKKYQFTTKQVAKILDKDERSVRRYQSGERGISSDVLYRIEKYEEEQQVIEKLEKFYKKEEDKIRGTLK